MPSSYWLQRAQEYRNRYLELAEELAFEQDTRRLAEVLSLSSQFGKITRLPAASGATLGNPDQAVTFLEHLAETLHSHAMQPGECIYFDPAKHAEIYNEIHQPNLPASQADASLFIEFFVDIAAICRADSGGYEVIDPIVLLEIIEAGKAAPGPQPSIVEFTSHIMSLRCHAEMFEAQGDTYQVNVISEAARILARDLRELIRGESDPPI